MIFDILVIVFFTSIVQSIFGTGVLLFGTPLMLISGYDFFTSLAILLPTSMLISVLQLINNIDYIDKSILKKIFLYSVPSIVAFLLLTNYLSINTNLFVGIYLIIISFKDNILIVKKIFKLFMRYESLYFLIMGAVHGLTNLGGALLSAIIFEKNISKNSKRSSIACSYLIFALFQIVTLFLIKNNGVAFNQSIFAYWIIGLLSFLVSNRYLFSKIKEDDYTNYSKIFLLVMGIVLLTNFFRSAF
tara:strand:- start:525 stop:1259 length:735 start_codon:yes stop_codon:yes gene_type:complete